MGRRGATIAFTFTLIGHIVNGQTRKRLTRVSRECASMRGEHNKCNNRFIAATSPPLPLPIDFSTPLPTPLRSKRPDMATMASTLNPNESNQLGHIINNLHTVLTSTS